jgi:single-strand DNA-binding protein
MIRNHITLIGNIGKNTQITNFENGKKVARFNLAINKQYRSNSGSVKSEVEWHNIFAWGNMANFIEEYAEKGKRVAVHGKLVNRNYLDKNGNKKQITEIELKNIIGL